MILDISQILIKIDRLFCSYKLLFPLIQTTLNR